jgi:hypothetical protein
MTFPESFLHYVWKFRLFDHQLLKTTDKEPIEIYHPGFHNRHSGPDFSESRIKIGNNIWFGQAEIHLKSSDWIRHQHHLDAAYDNVILHIVYEHDQDIRRIDGSIIPTLELSGRISEEIIQNSMNLLLSSELIPCSTQIEAVPDLVIQMWLERLAIDRLEYKTEIIKLELDKNQFDWENTLYVFLARNFGSSINAEPFELLAKSLPLKTLNKHRDNLLQIEAMLFGQAGFLEECYVEDYPLKLKNEFKHLSKKFNLRPIRLSSWKFGRMRPAAFPTIRIALFAQLIFNSKPLFSTLLQTENLEDLKIIFDLKVSEYWLTHYRFEDETEKRQNKSLGGASFYNIVINTFVPFLFLYGKRMKEESYCDRALRWLETIEAEKNVITEMWSSLGLEIINAHQSQALIHLKKHYCDQKQCLHCAIGNKLIASKSELGKIPKTTKATSY